MKRLNLVMVTLLVLVLTYLPAAAEEITPPRHDFPPVGTFQVLVGDFHMHTLNSDGKPTTRQRVEESYRCGYDVIAITDHGKTRAYRVAKYVGSQLGMIVLNGLETGIKSKEHMNAVGMSADYVPRDSHRWAEEPGQDAVHYRDEMKNIADHGGILIYNHPHVGYREPLKWGVEQGYVIGIEVKNDVVKDGWNTTEWRGIYCYPDAFNFAIENNLALFANTDVHGARNANPAKTLLFVEQCTPGGVIQAIRARRTVAWFDGVLWGRPGILEDLLRASVRVFTTAEGKLAFDNKSPITYKATIDLGDKVVAIEPYAVTTTGYTCSNPAVTIVWQNVWVDPLTNLATTYKL